MIDKLEFTEDELKDLSYDFCSKAKSRVKRRMSDNTAGFRFTIIAPCIDMENETIDSVLSKIETALDEVIGDDYMIIVKPIESEKKEE